MEHSSPNQKVPVRFLAQSQSGGMDYDEACIMHLTPGLVHNILKAVGVYRISVPYAQKDPRFLFEKRRGPPREGWSLFSTIDGTLPQDCVEEQLC